MASSLNRSQLSYGRDAADSGLWSYPSRVKGLDPNRPASQPPLLGEHTWCGSRRHRRGFSPASHSWIAALGRLRSFAERLWSCAAGLSAFRVNPPISPASQARSTPPPRQNAQSRKPALVGFLFAAFALVGTTAISYEIAWVRLLATTLGSSTYAFTLMIATFLLGITLGSMFHSPHALLVLPLLLDVGMGFSFLPADWHHNSYLEILPQFGHIFFKYTPPPTAQNPAPIYFRRLRFISQIQTSMKAELT